MIEHGCEVWELSCGDQWISTVIMTINNGNHETYIFLKQINGNQDCRMSYPVWSAFGECPTWSTSLVGPVGDPFC